ncbi:type II CRISPR RNA-guided endonuclease Cas9 [Mucilaginibacter psychrotolerans]|uniref:CRISPR-associated endonuclease Cas9 n=1 Tax=Mucilaginibacter psychrotolerans TaxID=1524096 RepID=A0A4Y8S9S9_9SPHI|nr:type II CRISPR RNA-guided endonuclease Cas9 [Mucilaginibacter psychrotolerans]TFF35738.1 type II CRISPR RNA-guided endonuclease Cas9 [Mucilaginibacter psychrotolerans]
MKTILGLDLGTNSIGWALIQQDFENKQGKILGLGSRIIPMSQDILGDFDKGVSVSQTKERTRLRSVRRLRERHLLRRERLHRVINVLGLLPQHYAAKIDFSKRLGKFLPETETKFVYDDNGAFIFKKSFEEMLADFKSHQPELLNRKNRKGDDAKIPYDWTVYYLRKKALTEKIENEELAWLLLHFNQKRGYYQLRGEEAEEKPNKLEEFYSLRIAEVTADEPQRGSDKIWYNLILENGWIYRRESKQPLFDWKGKVRDFIVTSDLNDDGSVRKDKEGNEKRSFRSPKEDDWKLLKKKTESEIEKSDKTVGEFIYDALLQKPDQKIRGKLVRTIERKFYKEELIRLLAKQIELNTSLQDNNMYEKCVEELYPHNLQHQATLLGKGFLHLFVDDILYYQRPLRSQKGTISNCPLESRSFMVNGIKKTEPLKCISKSHPLYQEFRLWQWISNLRIINKEKDIDETVKNLQLTEGVEALFDFLSQRKEIDQKALLKHFKLKESTYRWNYVEDKSYPCNETHVQIAGRLAKVTDISQGFLTKEKEEKLWHIIYSVTDKIEYEKALRSFAAKNNLNIESFYDAFKKFPPFPANYGSYSEKAIKKLLPLMRIGKYWDWDSIDAKTKDRIGKFINAEFDEEIKEKVREKIGKQAFTNENDYQGLPEWLAKYVVYDRHSERSETGKWNTVADLEGYLQSFRQHSLKNPIVEQVMTETLRTVKDIWQCYGNGAENFFDEIHIELGREMKNPADKRKSLTEQITKNENTNLRIKAMLMELLNNGVENVRPHSPMQQDILKIYEDAVLNGSIEIPEDIEKISKLALPTNSQLQRYKMWLDQKYRSPYTGAVIPLNKLFTPAYEIEHIIPQSRYYDDSFNNKVICEAAVNKLKDNQTGLEFIRNHYGQIVELGMGMTARIFTEVEYTDFVKQHYAKSYSKRNNLMALDVPEKMIERQLNDTRYISKFIMQALSNIVRAEKDDDGANSKNVLASNGKITSDLKQDWGMDAIWNELVLPRFERLNQITNSTNFTAYNERYQKHLPVVPLELQKGYQKKRIDHRHHAMDALIIACATRSHINYMNNRHALDKNKSADEKKKERFDLKAKLCDKKYNDGSSEHYEWIFKQPWATFVPDAKEKLQRVVVSFKQNLRVINKTVNQHSIFRDGKKVLFKQEKGESWAIRKSLHTPMPYGKKDYEFEVLKLSESLGKAHLIIDDNIKEVVKKILNQFNNKISDAQKFIKSNPIKDRHGNDVLDTAFKINIEKFRRRQPITKLSNRGQGGLKTIDDVTKFINKVADYKLQQDLFTHLKDNQNDIDKAFSAEAIETFNQKREMPVYKLPIAESGTGRFVVGQKHTTKHKWVEADTGTNLFFAVYADPKGKRSYETIPLNIVIERQKQGVVPVPEINGAGHDLLMYLSPNDLVFIPAFEDDGNIEGAISFTNRGEKIYKMVSCTTNRCFFIRQDIATPIVNKVEFSALNKMERSIDGKMIKDCCIKLKVDRLGNVSLATL